MNQKSGEVKSGLLAAILVIVILVSAVSIFRECGSSREGSLDVQDFGGYGGYAAGVVMEHLGSNGKVVVITFTESAAILFGKDHYAFIETLKANRFKVKVIEVGPGALLTDPAAMDDGVLSMDEYLAIAGDHPASQFEAIISLAGAPVPVPDPVPSAPADAPPLLIAQPIAQYAASLLVDSGFAAMAILKNENIPGLGAVPLLAEDFEAFYEVMVGP